MFPVWQGSAPGSVSGGSHSQSTCKKEFDICPSTPAHEVPAGKKIIFVEIKQPLYAYLWHTSWTHFYWDYESLFNVFIDCYHYFIKVMATRGCTIQWFSHSPLHYSITYNLTGLITLINHWFHAAFFMSHYTNLQASQLYESLWRFRRANVTFQGWAY